MTPGRLVATTRLLTPLSATVAVLAVLSAAYLLGTLDPATVGLVVAALVATRTTRHRHLLVPVSVGTDRTGRFDDDHARPLLRTRVTDPIHHPRRPRAPGTA